MEAGGENFDMLVSYDIDDHIELLNSLIKEISN